MIKIREMHQSNKENTINTHFDEFTYVLDWLALQGLLLTFHSILNIFPSLDIKHQQ